MLAVLSPIEANKYDVGLDNIQEIQFEDFTNYTTDLDIPGNGTVTGTEANTHGPGTESIQEIQFGGGPVLGNYTTDMDVPGGHGNVIGTEANTHGPGIQSIEEVKLPDLGIIISAFYTGADWVELYNDGPVDVDMSGWNFYWHDERGFFGNYFVPAGPLYTIPSNSSVVLLENAGADTATTWYIGHNVMWNQTESIGIAGEIRNPGGEGVDFFRAGNDTTNPTAPNDWFAPDIGYPMTAPGGFRDPGCIVYNYETDSGDDWIIDNSPPLPVTGEPMYTLEHRWRTEDIPSDIPKIILYVVARTNTGADDTFTFEYSEDYFTWVSTTINVNSDVMQTYTAILPDYLSGQLYLRVFDDNSTDTSLQDTVYIDEIYLQRAEPLTHSLDHIWRTQAIAPGAQNLTLFVEAGISAGSDDTFLIGYSSAVEGPYTPVIIIDNDIMQTYSAELPNSTSGVLYLKVTDDYNEHLEQQDTLIVDTIRILHKEPNTEPIVNFVVPSGGEIWRGGSSQTIEWNMTDDYTTLANLSVDIDYSTTGTGGSWTPLVTGQTGFVGNPCQWTWNPVPLVDSTNCYVRVRAMDDDPVPLTGENLSAASFTIDSTAPLPATNPHAELTWSASDDVTIYWDASPSPDVDHYEIWFITNGWDPTGDTYAWLDSAVIPAGAASYVHANRGGDNGFSYCYQVRTYDTAGHETRTTIQAAKYGRTLPFAQGDWWLAGSALMQSDTSLNHVIQGFNLPANRDYVLAFDATTQQWITYLEGRDASLNLLTDITNEMGFWMHITGNARFATAGYIEDMSIDCYAGWNLVPYPYAARGMNTDDIELDLIANCPNYVPGSLTIRDNSQPYYIRSPASDTITFREEGIWIQVTADTIWTVLNY